MVMVNQNIFKWSYKKLESWRSVSPKAGKPNSSFFCIIVHAHASYEIVMPTKNRQRQNYLLACLKSFKDKHIFLYRHGENFDDFETAYIKDIH